MQLKTAVKFAISAIWSVRSNKWPGRSSRAAIIASPVGWSRKSDTTQPIKIQSSLPPSWMWKPPMSENQRLYAAIGYEETGRGTEAGYERVFMRKRLAGDSNG